jgi:periplasmic copper chaperone A
MRRPGLLVAGALALAVAAGGCGSSDDPQQPKPSTVDISHGGSAKVGSLQISGAYVPQPASPATAAAYFTIRNNGDSADSLRQISTPISSMAMLHRYRSTGPDTEKMTDIMELKLPPHQTIQLRPGQLHVMIENPQANLKKGDVVALTLVFAHAGKVTLQAPVTAIGRGPQD